MIGELCKTRNTSCKFCSIFYYAADFLFINHYKPSSIILLMRQHSKTISEIRKRLAKHNAKLIFLCISGSHTYGFPSRDSDWDYRGIFINKTENVLGLDKPDDKLELKIGEEDIVLFEIEKALKLALAGNNNTLEWMKSKAVLEDPECLEFKKLVGKNIPKSVYNAYKGTAVFNYKKFIKQGRKTVKKYLYILRALMAGIYVLETGKIEPDITKLNKCFRLDVVDELVKLKTKGEEQMKNSVPEERIEKLIEELHERIDEAYAKTSLPEKADKEKFNKFLLKIRKKN